MRPPALEISAAPDRDVPNLWQLQRTIDPAAAAPTRRPNIPIRMIVKRYERYRLGSRSQPQSAQMVKVTRTIKNKFSELRRDLTIKLFSRPGRSGKSKPGAPVPRVDSRQGMCDVAPRIIEIEMDRETLAFLHGLSRGSKRDSLARATRKFF